MSIISTGVRLDINCPISAAIITERYEPTGPPYLYPNAPTIEDEMMTNVSYFIPTAMARPIQEATNGDYAERASAIKERNERHSILAIWEMIRPNISEQNKP